MPVRIYSLAKELKLDSKVLVDICTSAGVLGKGSALASLTDEEVDRVKAFMNAPAPSLTRPTQTAAPAPKRPPVLAPTTPIPVLEPKSSSHAPAPAAPIAAVAPPVAEQAPAAPVAAAPPEQLGHRREDYMGPGGTGADRVPMLGDKSSMRKKAAGDAAKPSSRPPVQRSGPGIKLAALPSAPQPPAKPVVNEPAPQKPDLKLPPDAIRAGRAGTKPLSEHLRKHETKKRQEADQEAANAGRAGQAPRGGKAGRKGVGESAPVAPAASAGRPRRGRVPTEAEIEADRALLGGREQRQLARKKVGGEVRRRGPGDEEETPAPRRRPRVRMQRTGTNTAAPRKSNITLELPCTVRSFSEAVGVPAQQVLRKLLAMGTMTTITAKIDSELAELLAVELGVEIDFKHEVDFAKEQVAAVELEEDDAALLEPRPPVITFLGHVDHGKTSLLDKLIGINVVSGESGGITQHIRAYQIDKDGRKISFVDTPGHEAFTEMRARGANVTDIAVLVVAADDGVMPQTEEAISHIRAADVPIVVALNKIDLPGVDIDRIYQQLATNNLLPSEWGGDTEVVKTSATTGVGLDELLDTLLTMAELHDFRANPNRAAYGTCLEAEVHEGRGVVAKLIVQNGTLKVGDAVVCGSSYGRVKALYDTLKTNVTYQQAPPSMPVNVTGLNEAPGAGEHFHVLENIATARQIAELRAGHSRREILGGITSHVTLENLFDHLGQEEAQSLNMILRADTRGSIEAIQKELTKLDHPEVKIKILQASVGGVSEADVHLADASDAVIIAFNVVPDDRARGLAERQGVQVRRYDIIYKVSEDLKAALEGMLKPEQREMELGRALVQRTFVISRVGTIAGCRVLSGVIQRNARVRLIRDNRVMGDYALDSLKREKDDAREVREGLECGIKVGGFNDLKEGDILEAYKVEEIARTF